MVAREGRLLEEFFGGFFWFFKWFFMKKEEFSEVLGFFLMTLVVCSGVFGRFSEFCILVYWFVGERVVAREGRLLEEFFGGFFGFFKWFFMKKEEFFEGFGFFFNDFSGLFWGFWEVFGILYFGLLVCWRESGGSGGETFGGVFCEVFLVS